MVRSIVAHAVKHGRRPDRVFRDYLKHPRQYHLMWAYENWAAEQEAEAIKRANKGKPGGK